ncbi:hypothetical protein ACRQEG_03320 [Actinotignum sp. GS-2025f]|uniref:GntT/GntP/DsdX family permease n=1 Tax=Actinotignum sp. GS-2025f TaxID=3427279 RepID=UPI003F45359B
MPLVILALGIALLLFLMIVLKMNGFIALVIVSVVVGMAQGMPLLATVDDKGEKVKGLLDVIQSGVGGQTGKLVLLLGFGAMLGVFMADMGAANRLATTMINKFGIKHSQLAIVIVSFLVGVVRPPSSSSSPSSSPCAGPTRFRLCGWRCPWQSRCPRCTPSSRPTRAPRPWRICTTPPSA